MGEWVLFVNYIECTFCPKKWPLTSARVLEYTKESLIPAHMAIHIEEALHEAEPVLHPRCSRCQRLEKAPAGTPHRPCFLPDCTCECSYPAKETPVAE